MRVSSGILLAGHAMETLTFSATMLTKGVVAFDTPTAEITGPEDSKQSGDGVVVVILEPDG